MMVMMMMMCDDIILYQRKSGRPSYTYPLVSPNRTLLCPVYMCQFMTIHVAIYTDYRYIFTTVKRVYNRCRAVSRTKNQFQ